MREKEAELMRRLKGYGAYYSQGEAVLGACAGADRLTAAGKKVRWSMPSCLTENTNHIW